MSHKCSGTSVVPDYCLFFNLYQKAWEFNIRTDRYVCKYAFLFVWVVPASFPEQICVAICCTALSWLPVSPQSGYSHLSEVGDQRVPSFEWCLCPCDIFQLSGSLYGSWEVGSCLWVGHSCFPAFPRGASWWVVLCVFAAQPSGM